MDLLNITEISEHEMGKIVDMKGIKLEKTLKKDALYEILRKYDKIIHDESPFKSIILDIRSILPKKGYKSFKKSPKYIEEIKKLTYYR